MTNQYAETASCAGALSALATGSRALAGAGQLAEGINHLLAHIGAVTGGSRVWVFQLIDLQDDAIVQDYVFEWASATRYRQLTQRRFRFFATLFDDPAFLRLVTQRRAGQRQSLVTQQLAPGSLRRNLESQNILSMATVPILVNGQWWGTLGIDDCERAISWEGAGLDTLTLAAELIASAVYRQQLNSRSQQVELFHKVTDCGVWEVDLSSGELWCSQGLRRTLGYPETYLRTPLRRLMQKVVKADRHQLWERLRHCLAEKATLCRQDVRIHLPAGTRWSEIVADITYDEHQRPVQIAGLLIDISQRKQSEEQAQAASFYDALTESLNRRGFSHRFAQTLQAPSAAVDPSIGHYLLLVDIDHFKQVNDRYGHPAGDALLCQLVQRVQTVVRQQDTFARLGGEEFAVLASQVTREQACNLARRLRETIAAAPFLLRNLDSSPIRVNITVSIGLARVTDGSDLAERQETVTAHADQALYAAKQYGRNRVVGDWELQEAARPGAGRPEHDGCLVFLPAEMPFEEGRGKMTFSGSGQE